MKKLFMFIVSCGLIFAACKNDGNDNKEVSNTVRVRVEAATSMDARGISQQDVVPALTDVKVYVFDSNDKYLTTWNATWDSQQVEGSYSVSRDELLVDGNYRFLAVGLVATADYSFPSLTAGTTTFQEMIATVATGDGAVKELFSGWANKTITSDMEEVTITMDRQVAGFLGYFQNVPTEINGTPTAYLRLIASVDNTKLDLSVPEGQGPTVNDYQIFNIPLSGQGKTTVDGVEVWTGNAADNPGAVQLPNSQLAAGYAIPVSPVTLTLALFAEGGTTPLRSWTVKDAASGSSSLSLEPNQLFSIGRKVATGSTNGGTTGDTSDDDATQNLALSQNVVVNISTNWGAVNDMTLQSNP